MRALHIDKFVYGSQHPTTQLVTCIIKHYADPGIADRMVVVVVPGGTAPVSCGQSGRSVMKSLGVFKTVAKSTRRVEVGADWIRDRLHPAYELLSGIGRKSCGRSLNRVITLASEADDSCHGS